MLLDLYLAHLEGRKTYLWSLCMASHVPTTSAHRKITELTRKGLLARSADGEDGRRVSVTLTTQCTLYMDDLLDQIAIVLGITI
jgi:DNA-binding MarR family transcriptional regulator